MADHSLSQREGLSQHWEYYCLIMLVLHKINIQYFCALFRLLPFAFLCFCSLRLYSQLFFNCFAYMLYHCSTVNSLYISLVGVTSTVIITPWKVTRPPPFNFITIPSMYSLQTRTALLKLLQVSTRFGRNCPSDTLKNPKFYDDDGVHG